MSEKKLTAEEFVRRVLAETFGQRVDKETVREVAKKVREAVATKQKPPREKEAA
jgi:hypothetical protein